MAPTPCAYAPTLFDDKTARTPEQVQALRQLCWSCPAQPQCYLVAITTSTSEVGGFLAGLTERQRRAAHRAVAA